MRGRRRCFPGIMGCMPAPRLHYIIVIHNMSRSNLLGVLKVLINQARTQRGFEGVRTNPLQKLGNGGIGHGRNEQ